MKNFIISIVLVCIVLFASGSRIRNTAVLDQNIKARAPVRIPTLVNQRMQNPQLNQRLANGRMILKAQNVNGQSVIQPIVGQPNQYHNHNQNQNYYKCNNCGSVQEDKQGCC